MDLFSFFQLGGGLAFFLFGMHLMSGSLERLAGGKLELILKKMTSNPFKSLLLGAGVTIAIQSSSALTVMLVGLVNSGIMELGQTVGIIMGSNIGTTLTAWILSLSGIQSSNIFLRLIKPESFSPVLALIGVIMIMSSEATRRRDIGSILVGFAILMYGMQDMTEAVSPLADMPQFSSILTAFNNPLLGVLVGTVFTGVIQSSAASIGILQALSLTGSVTFGMAIPIIMGQNIGTCVTSVISAIGVSRNAKRVAAVHISFNVIGTAIFLSAFYLAEYLIGFSFIEDAIGPVEIAMFHTTFNVATTVILLPFSKQLEQIARMVVRDKKPEATEEEPVLLDERLFQSPSFAIHRCHEATAKMADLSRDSLLNSLTLIRCFDVDKAREITETEEKIDNMEDDLTNYLTKLSYHKMSEADGASISELLHCIGDFERIGDHAMNIQKTSESLNNQSSHLSPAARDELNVMISALTEVLTLATDAFRDDNVEAAGLVEPLEEVVDDLTDEMKIRHVRRIQSGICTAEMGILYSDMLTNFERVSDHCSNIGVYVIQSRVKKLKTHNYLTNVKSGKETAFSENYRIFSEKYHLPPESVEIAEGAPIAPQIPEVPAQTT
jgi:phosphate:Na+ symporter